MPQLVVIALSTGEVTNVIACDNESYAAEVLNCFARTNLQAKVIPLDIETRKMFAHHIVSRNSTRAIYQD